MWSLRRGPRRGQNPDFLSPQSLCPLGAQRVLSKQWMWEVGVSAPDPQHLHFPGSWGVPGHAVWESGLEPRRVDTLTLRKPAP